ncbi:MAG: hypothetical protein WBX22_01070 [Silvibacterium sp.]
MALQYQRIHDEKIAVFAPIESASVRITVALKPGLRHDWRAANLRFCPKASIDDAPGELAEIARRDINPPYVEVPEKIPSQTRLWKLRDNPSHIA